MELKPYLGKSVECRVLTTGSPFILGCTRTKARGAVVLDPGNTVRHIRRCVRPRLHPYPCAIAAHACTDNTSEMVFHHVLGRLFHANSAKENKKVCLAWVSCCVKCRFEYLWDPPPPSPFFSLWYGARVRLTASAGCSNAARVPMTVSDTHRVNKTFYFILFYFCFFLSTRRDRRSNPCAPRVFNEGQQ